MGNSPVQVELSSIAFKLERKAFGTTVTFKVAGQFGVHSEYVTALYSERATRKSKEESDGKEIRKLHYLHGVCGVCNRRLCDVRNDRSNRTRMWSIMRGQKVKQHQRKWTETYMMSNRSNVRVIYSGSLRKQREAHREKSTQLGRSRLSKRGSGWKWSMFHSLLYCCTVDVCVTAERVLTIVSYHSFVSA